MKPTSVRSGEERGKRDAGMGCSVAGAKRAFWHAARQGPRCAAKAASYLALLRARTTPLRKPRYAAARDSIAVPVPVMKTSPRLPGFACARPLAAVAALALAALALATPPAFARTSHVAPAEVKAAPGSLQTGPLADFRGTPV